MSEENVEVVREFFRAWEGGDLGGALAVLDPGVITERVHPAPDAQVYRGVEGVVQAGIDWFESFDELVMTGEEFIEVNDEQVLVRVHQQASGDSSGVPVDADFWFLYTLGAAKVTRIDMYMTKAQALEAVGLRE
jgi:ketosteroid isomerase-like protein